MKRARVELVAPPFSGHLHPLLGIARRLARDHDVRLVSTERAQAQIAAAGLEGRALLLGQDAAIARIVDPPRAVRSNPLRLDAQLRANLALMERFREELLALWSPERPDLLIADFTLPVAGALAAELGIPWWTSLPSPCVIEAPDGPPAYLGGLRPWPGPLGRLRDAAGRALVRAFKRGVHLLHRAQLRRLGYPTLYRADGSEAVYSPARVFALGLAELEFPRRWPAAVELVGPVLYTPPHDGPEPPFRTGRSHVLVTLGTHLKWLKDAAANAARQVARALPDVEVHFSDGDGDSVRVETDGNFHRFGYVSYGRDLARYALVVHHGGAGVLHHCIRAGVPALVWPADYDQFDHAARLEAAGLAWRVKRPRDLPALVARALQDPGLVAASRRFREIAAGYAAEERIATRVAAQSRP